MEYLHTMLRVASLTDSLDFYCHKLGLIEIRRKESKQGRFTLVFLATEADTKNDKAPMLELTYNWDQEKYHNGRNFGHLAYLVDNIYDYCQRLMDQDVLICRPPRDGRMAFIKSPDNISIEILQKGAALVTQDPWLSMKNIGSW